jgi:hypothetical protein
MYFPYLRGKQFDLIAIRELTGQISKSRVIHPIIEPVRDSTSTLRITIDQLSKDNVPYTLIINPEFGDYSRRHSEVIDFINQQLSDEEKCHIGVILSRNIDLGNLDRLVSNLDGDFRLVLIHNQRVSNLNRLKNFIANWGITYNLYRDTNLIRRYRRIIDNQTKVLLSDSFNSQRVNADYADEDDEFFTDEHIFYAEDGFVGFADYTTIGDDYSDTGFAPYAVAIHLTYLRDNGEIWIRHFVSDSNEDYTDVAGKYREALTKLITFINKNNIHTRACEEFREHYSTGHYPGLGSVKKLSIQHHIELVNSILST